MLAPFFRSVRHYPAVCHRASSGERGLLHRCSPRQAPLPVRAAPVRGDIPEEKDRDRERIPIFGSEKGLVAPAQQTPREAYRPLAALQIRGDREVAQEVGLRLVSLAAAGDLELASRFPFRGGDENFLTIRDHPV